MDDASTGFTKLTYSHMQPPEVQSAMRLFADPDKLVKAAGSKFECDDDALKPGKGCVGIQVVALGDYEHYGQNRNADAFRKKACEDRHTTFVKDGHVFINHDNTDPAKSIGSIVKSAYDKDMGRIELIIHVDENKGAPQLDRLEKEGTAAFSMACFVPFDSCNICNKPRRGPSDSSQCEHLRDHLGEVYPDGKVACMQNDYPTWFDLSFVPKPADRIAYDLKKIASSGGVVSSYKLAQDAGIIAPPSVMGRVCPGYTEKQKIVKQLTGMEEFYKGAANTKLAGHAFYLWELRKAASRLSDADIETLRGADHSEVLPALCKAGCMLSPNDFFRYVFGTDHGSMKAAMPEIMKSIRGGIYNKIANDPGLLHEVCKNMYFDVDTDSKRAYSSGVHGDLCRHDFVGVAHKATMSMDSVNQRVIDATLAGRDPEVAKLASANSGIHPAALVYAAYQVSTLNEVQNGSGRIDKAASTAIAAAQNVTV